jgi:hypothetical protein
MNATEDGCSVHLLLTLYRTIQVLCRCRRVNTKMLKLKMLKCELLCVVPVASCLPTRVHSRLSGCIRGRHRGKV